MKLELLTVDTKVIIALVLSSLLALLLPLILKRFRWESLKIGSKVFQSFLIFIGRSFLSIGYYLFSQSGEKDSKKSGKVVEG